MARTFIKRCQCCDATFTAKNHTAKWCSSRCGMRAYQRRRRGAPEADPAWWHEAESPRRVVSRSALVQPEIMEDPDELPLAWRKPEEQPVGLEVRQWQGTPIQRRAADGYVNATAMAKANGKHLPHYMTNERTNQYLQALSGSVGIPTDLLVRSIVTGPNDQRGTWVHPRLAVDLARWISPAFAVWMDGWFLESLTAPQPPKQLTLQGLDDQHPIKVIAASEAEALNIWHHAIFKAMQQGLAAAFAPYSGRVHSKVNRAGFEFVPNGKELPFVSYLPPN